MHARACGGGKVNARRRWGVHSPGRAQRLRQRGHTGRWRAFDVVDARTSTDEACVQSTYSTSQNHVIVMQKLICVAHAGSGGGVIFTGREPPERKWVFW